MLPPEETSVEALPPTWVTEELIEKTVRVWSRIYGRTISTLEALEILNEAGRLMDILTPQRATMQLVGFSTTGILG